MSNPVPTKREHIATEIHAALISNEPEWERQGYTLEDCDQIARVAVERADALLNALKIEAATTEVSGESATSTTDLAVLSDSEVPGTVEATKKLK